MPGAQRRIPQVWPPVTYPWVPYPWDVGGSGPKVLTPDRICLGSQCWPWRRMTIANAKDIARILLSKSWPIAKAVPMAMALADRGYRMQARAVLRVYGDANGVAAINEQILNVYRGTVPVASVL